MSHNLFTMNDSEVFLKKAIALAEKNVAAGGGPFGAIIVKDGIIIAEGVNRVTLDNDPTAHAEVCAIRDACKQLNTFTLQGCVLYSSCEPCPMCLSAIYWARIDTLYFAATRLDAHNAGFDDDFLYKEIPLPLSQRAIASFNPTLSESIRPFNAWIEHEHRVKY